MFNKFFSLFKIANASTNGTTFFIDQITLNI